MASLRDIKRRITSVKSTQKITRAMKMVAAAKLRRAQEAILQSRPYSHRMRDLVNNLALRAELDAHPLLRRAPESGKVGVIVVTSDRGLCGGFNSSITNTTLEALKTTLEGREVELTVVGRKGDDLLKRRPVTIRASHINVQDHSLLDVARSIIDDIAEDFIQDGVSEVYCLYNEFKSAISQKVVLEKLLPFEPHADTEEKEDDFPVDYLYEPSVEEVFEDLLVKHLHIQIHRILQESAASEHGARMTAMESATTNAGDMIDRLTLQYNRVRQDAITTELIEVVSGAEAL